jgi:hypothetical protein
MVINTVKSEITAIQVETEIVEDHGRDGWIRQN